MYKKLFMLLNQMIFDLFTRELFPIFSIWKNANALPMAPAPAKSINTLKQSQQRHCIVNCIKEPAAERKLKSMFTFRLSTIHDETTTVTENYSTSLTTESCNAYSFTVDNQ